MIRLSCTTWLAKVKVSRSRRKVDGGDINKNLCGKYSIYIHSPNLQSILFLGCTFFLASVATIQLMLLLLLSEHNVTFSKFKVFFV